MAATSDKDLTSTLKAARGGKPMRFAFLPKGSEGKLLVGKKIPPQQIAETKQEIGASSVLKGRCVGEGGTLVFYVAKDPPGTLLGQLRKRVKEDAGLTWPIEIRVSADAEAEPAEGEAEAAGGAGAAPGTPESPRAVNLEAAYQARVKALTEDLQKAIASGTEAGKEAKLRFSEAQVFARKQDFARATALLDVVEQQIQKALAGAPAGGDLAAQWKAKLAEYTPALKAALAAKGPNAAAIAKLLAQAVALSKPGGDLAQALAKLTEGHALATGRMVDGEGSAADTAGQTPTGPDLAAQWKKNLAAWTPAIKAALAAKGPNAAAIGKLLAQAVALSRPGGDMAQALEKLTECHALATSATADGAAKGAEPAEGQTQSNARSPETAADHGADTDEARWAARREAINPLYLDALKQNPPNASQLRAALAFADSKAEAKDFAKALQGLDSLEKLLQAPTETNGEATAALQRWQAACTEVKNQLRKVQGEIARAKDEYSARAVMRLESVAKNLSLRPATQQDVVELEAWVRADDVITRAEQPNPWGLPVQVRGKLLPVLAALKKQLPA